jgi:hypothetical protein
MPRRKPGRYRFRSGRPGGTARSFQCEQAFCCSKGQSGKSPLTPGRKGQSFLYPQWLFRDYSFSQLLLFLGLASTFAKAPVLRSSSTAEDGSEDRSPLCPVKRDRVSPSCSLCSQYRFHDARQFICPPSGLYIRLNLGGNRFFDGLFEVVHGQLSTRLGV